MKLKCLRTFFHSGDVWHRPLRNITIEHWCAIKRCSNHSIIIIQKRKKRQKNKYQRMKKIGNNVSNIQFVILKWKTIKNNIQKKGDKEFKLNCLRTLLHGGDAWHRPLRNITIEHWCLIKRCSNHSITIIQKEEENRK